MRAMSIGFPRSVFHLSFLGGSVGKVACNVGDPGSIPEWGRSPEEGNGNPLQYSCLENPMDRRARWARVHRVAKSQTRLKRLSTHTHKYPLGTIVATQ